MSIASEIKRIQSNIANAYQACADKGAELPGVKNSENLASCISSIAKEDSNNYKVYGVLIDTTNSVSLTSVTYIKDAMGMTAGSNDWDSTEIFKNIKPCLLKDGIVQYYLDRNDFTKKEDGTASDITSGADGDVMIEIPKLGYRIDHIGNYIKVEITDNPNAEGFKYYAHTREVEGDREKLYIGAYLAYHDGTALCSLSGKSPKQNINLPGARSATQIKGAGYDLVSFYPLTLIQCLFLLRYKSLNSQSALGAGYSNASAVAKTGATSSQGMYYGSTSKTTHVKFAGIEDLWGNLWWWIDGVRTNASRDLLTTFSNFNDTGDGYINQGSLGAVNTNGTHAYMKEPQGTSEMGFVLKTTGGSNTTYYPDSTAVSPSSVPIFGGRWVNDAACGIFALILEKTPDLQQDACGARIM
jgi:hypothetical protein